MGAASSKTESSTVSGQEKLQNVNRTLLNKIENPTGASSSSTLTQTYGSNSEKEKQNESKVPSLDRQQYLDSSIQGKIREELSRLRKQDSDLQKQIEQALEKESLDIGSQNKTGAKGKSSILLKQELDDVRSKIERHNQRREKVDKAPGVKNAREKVIQCYNKNPNTSLECWAEVRDFRQAVSRAESVSCRALNAFRMLNLLTEYNSQLHFP